MSTESIMPSNHLILCSSPSPPTLSLSQHQGLFQWVGSWHQVAKILERQLRPSVLPMNIKGYFPLGLTCLISLQSKGLSGVFSSTTAWKHQFFGAQPSLWSNSHIRIWASHSNSLLEEGIKHPLETFRTSLHCTNAEDHPIHLNNSAAVLKLGPLPGNMWSSVFGSGMRLAKNGNLGHSKSKHPGE